MTRHPSENFIKYLMTSAHPQATSDDWVREFVASLGYPRPEPDYLSWLRASLSMKIPDSFEPTNRYNRDSVKFMREEGIYGLHNPDKATKEAHLIVTNLRIRPVVESLVLGRLDPKDVAKKVNTRFGEFLTGDGVDAYRHYYWQVNIIRVEDWVKLFQEYELQQQNSLAIVQVGASMALHKMGFQQQIDSKSMLREMQQTLFFDFQEWRTKPHGMSRTKALAALAKSSVVVDEQLSQADSAMKDSLKAFEQFRMQTANKGVVGLKELAPGGNFTGSGAKLIDIPVKEEEEAGE